MSNGTLMWEYIWTDYTLAATRGAHAGQALQYVVTDHLDTPHAVVLPSTNAIVWRWDLTDSTFGEPAALNNPDGDTASYTFNLRYPAQHFASESGCTTTTSATMSRGRGGMCSGNPIGQTVGLSKLSLAWHRPLEPRDPLGLSPFLVSPWKQLVRAIKVGNERPRLEPLSAARVSPRLIAQKLNSDRGLAPGMNDSSISNA
jgi:hypothetical protein